MTAAGKQMDRATFRGETLSARNHARRRNPMVTGFLRPSYTFRPCIKDSVLLDTARVSGLDVMYSLNLLTMGVRGASGKMPAENLRRLKTGH